MAFQVPESKRSIGQNEYEFTIGKKTHKIPAAKFLAVGQLAQLTGTQNVAAMLDLFGAAGTPAGDAVRELDVEQLTALVQDWVADSGLTPGESPAS